MRQSRWVLLALVISCGPNPYAKYYQGVPDARVRHDYAPSAAPLQIYSFTDFNRDILELVRRGYAVIGWSSFNAAMSTVRASQLRNQAAQVGAQVVLVAAQYTNRVSGAIPLTVPGTATTTTTGAVTAVGSSGSGTAYGTGTTTTYGTRTLMNPYAIARGDFAALYCARIRVRVGLYVVPLDDSTRRRMQSNFGVRLLVVVEGSPASNADILPGDVVTEFEGERVSSVEHFRQLADANAGRSVDVVVDRSGQEVQKRVKLLSLAGS